MNTPLVMTLRELANLVSGHVAPEHESLEIHGPASLLEAGPGDIAFFGNTKYLRALQATQATAVLVPHGFEEKFSPAPIWVDNPTASFAKILERFAPAPLIHTPGIHPTAFVSETAAVAPTASVGPKAVIESGASVGTRSIIGAGAFVGHDAVIGEDCHLHANTTVQDRCRIGNRVIIHSGAVVGADGFGYELQDGRQIKVPQTGIVQIDDDVEIGANTTIDRARFGRTWIQTGVKIDNLVQIAHNVRIGAHTIVCAQVGVSGSTRIGSHATLAGQAGIVGHLEIGDRVIIAAQSGVSRSIGADEIVAGGPCRPIKEYREVWALISRLAKLFKRVKKLEETAGLKP